MTFTVLPTRCTPSRSGESHFIVTNQRHGQTPALVYNAFSGGLAFGPRIPAQLQHGFNIVVDAGEALYAFSSPCYNKDSSFQVMTWVPTALDQLDAKPLYPQVRRSGHGELFRGHHLHMTTTRSSLPMLCTRMGTLSS
jgi:hypothetical protein